MKILKTKFLREILVLLYEIKDSITVAIAYRKEMKNRITRSATYKVRRIWKSSLISARILVILKVLEVEIDKIDTLREISWIKNLSLKFKIEKRIEEIRKKRKLVSANNFLFLGRS